MADRYFPNDMPDFVKEEQETVVAVQEEEEEQIEPPPPPPPPQGTQAFLLKLLSLPYPSLSPKLQRAALDLKETVVVETWGFAHQQVQDFSLYTGALGTAFLLFKSYQVTRNKNDLNLCSEIVKACDSASFGSRNVTFICGRAGVCALGAVVAEHMGNTHMVNHYLTQFTEITVEKDHPNELLYGRAGYLWASLFLKEHFGHGMLAWTYTSKVVKEVIKNGRELGASARCPLMYEWYGERYWGAAHGVAGIMYVLMHFELLTEEHEDVKRTLKYMIKNRFSSGNYPGSEEDLRRDVLAHWCHGAPGMALTLAKAAEVYKDKEFLEAAIDAAEVVWNRGLLRRVGICHGISGSAYAFLSLYRLTGNVEFFYRAKAFACFLLDRALRLIAEGEMNGGDNPYSLFEGIGGMAYFFLDMTDPSNARFPGYEL